MRRLMVVLAVLTLAVALGSMTASAQTGISLSTSSTSGITFMPAGSGDLSMLVAVGGSAAGLGALLGTTGFYSLTAAIPVALTLGPSSPLVFAAYTASSTLNFDITSGMGGTGTDLLKGTLALVSFAQVFSTGMTNTSGLVDITITGGTLQSFFLGNTGISQLTINLAGLGFLPSLSGPKGTTLKGGVLNALVVPEPKSMLLWGSGLVLFGIMLRRRLLAQSS